MTRRRPRSEPHVIHRVLKEARSRLGEVYTLRKVAAKVGVSTAQMSHYETGESNPPVDILKRLCVLYRISADEALGIPREDEKWKLASKDEHLDFLVRRKSILEFFACRPTIREVRVVLCTNGVQVHVYKGGDNLA